VFWKPVKACRGGYVKIVQWGLGGLGRGHVSWTSGSSVFIKCGLCPHNTVTNDTVTNNTGSLACECSESCATGKTTDGRTGQVECVCDVGTECRAGPSRPREQTKHASLSLWIGNGLLVLQAPSIPPLMFLYFLAVWCCDMEQVHGHSLSHTLSLYSLLSLSLSLYLSLSLSLSSNGCSLFTEKRDVFVTTVWLGHFQFASPCAGAALDPPMWKVTIYVTENS